MPFRLRPGTPSDVPQMTTTSIATFASNHIHQRCFPAATGGPEFWRTTLGEEISDPSSHFLVIEDTDASPPAFTAFAKWVRTPAGTHPSPVTEDLFPADGDPALALAFFGALARQHAEIMGGRAHWYLELICTRPEHQRKGAAGMLMRWGVERADAEGWPAYLDATPDGKPVYERYGFREVKTLGFAGGGVRAVLYGEGCKGGVGMI